MIIVDADDQKSVLTWYNNRPEDLPHIPVTGATGNIKAMLKEHENPMILLLQTVLAVIAQKCVVD